MSPEICENKAYTYASDIWSLGCLLYELCTLEHAFQADNLLGLVFKIVKDQAEPIPSRYTPELAGIVKTMLSKDVAARATIAHLLRTPYIIQAMQTFASSHGASAAPTAALSVRKIVNKVIPEPQYQAPPQTN